MEGLACLLVALLLLGAGYLAATRLFGYKFSGMLGGKERFRLLPGEGAAAHQHMVELDKQGNGVSTSTDGHVHDVRAFVVETAAGHTHQLDGRGL